MQNSVQLNQLPYTGFDYGLVPNSLFWVALLVWSIFIARVILRNSPTIAKVFAVLAQSLVGGSRAMLPMVRVPIEEESSVAPEPVILTERIVTPVDPSIKERAQQARERVRAMVDQELVTSRKGQAPDEFSSGDFAVVDFDGINPDDAWQPSTSKPQTTQTSTPMQKPMPSAIPDPASFAQNIPIQKTPEVIDPLPIAVAAQKQYKDTMQLDASGEYPRISLKRQEVA